MRYKKGQALALILLVMSSVLVVGISIASRSISSLRISTQTERSQRAFNAAEAGIQEALRRDPRNLVSGQTLNFDGVSVNISSKPITGLTGKIFKDKAVQLGIQNSSGLTISWGKTGETEADLEIILIKNNGDMIKYYCDVASRVSNDNCGDVLPGNGYKHVFSLGSGSLSPGFVRIIAHFADTSVNVSGGSLSTNQNFLVESSATTDEGLVRKVQVVTSSPALPEVFDYSLYSGTGLE